VRQTCSDLAHQLADRQPGQYHAASTRIEPCFKQSAVACPDRVNNSRLAVDSSVPLSCPTSSSRRVGQRPLIVSHARRNGATLPSTRPPSDKTTLYRPSRYARLRIFTYCGAGAESAPSNDPGGSSVTNDSSRCNLSFRCSSRIGALRSENRL
jgi:hypothetical protein